MFMIKNQPNLGSDEDARPNKRFLKSRRCQLIFGGGILVIIAIVIAIVCTSSPASNGLKSISSTAELNKVYDERYGSSSSSLTAQTVVGGLLALPYYLIGIGNSFAFNSAGDIDDRYYLDGQPVDYASNDRRLGLDTGANESSSSPSSSNDYSTTNIQVENVDEADITKTDGEYIYSLSDDKVVITDAHDPANLQVTSEITTIDGYPIDLMLSDNDKLVVISENVAPSTYRYGSSSMNDTLVNIYNIVDHENPDLVKSFRLYEPYYTSRRIDDKLYVISSGTLRKTQDDVDHYYREDGREKELPLGNIYKLEGVKTVEQTLLAEVNLSNLDNINLNSYLVDINNAYISENNVYLANEAYSSDSEFGGVNWWSIFGWKGVWGLRDTPSYSSSSRNAMSTEVYKFNITDNGLRYVAQIETEGKVVNQFSFDEYEGNLRMATKSNDGSRIVVFDEKLNQIGASEYVAKGENMYSSRFLGPRAYFVTYLVTDPLYVVDVSNPQAPKILGELKIPGYSTYLHPYDETHLIGIGMDSTETTRRDSTGRIVSTSSRITGMKMALFDVSNVLSPKQISEVKIGDSRTTSAILTNHKALLFSKEKELIAIPVNNYQDDFEIAESTNIETLTRSYTSYSEPYVSEGYFVYGINLSEGITEKGRITHNATESWYSSSRSSSTRLLRGLYIGDNLFTVSEDMIQANALSDLTLINQLNLIKE
jgi:uncharacterized secreted protein with C-terminal beta-propeller domain